MHTIMPPASLNALLSKGIDFVGKTETRMLVIMAFLATAGIGAVRADSLDPCDPLT